MRVMIEGQDLTAWTLAGALSSTGCQVSINATQLPLDDEEVTEPDLSRLLEQQFQAGRLVLDNWDHDAQLLILADDLNHADGYIDHLKRQFFTSKPYPLDQLKVIALVQPVSIGTSEQIGEWLQTQLDQAIDIVYWPSFIQAGRALESFVRPERILLGSNSADATAFMKHMLNPFNRSRDTLMVMSLKEAELSKLAINGMLATRVSFMNEIAQLAEQHNVDVERVRQGVGTDARIGFQYLYPGCGFGGKAFLNTLLQLSGAFDDVKTIAGRNLLKSVYEINEQQKDLLFQKFWRYYRADIQGKRVAIWGCAFKPNTASVDGSPALNLVSVLLAHDVQVSVYDPRAMPNFKKYMGEHPNLHYANFPEEALDKADALMLVTEWKEFWNLDMAMLQKRVTHPLLLDGRNIYDPQRMKANGWVYSGVGRS